MVRVNNFCVEALHCLNAQQPVEPDVARKACIEALSIEDPLRRVYFLGALLHGMMVAGPTVEQVSALLSGAFSLDCYDPAARPKMETSLPSVTLIGSGKKGLKTVNISSLAAVTASSTGEVAVCKPSSGATSSLTGSADFVRAFGIPLEENLDRMHEVAGKLGLGVFSVASCVPQFVDRYDGTFFTPHALSFGLAGLLAPFRTDALVYGLAHPNTALSYEVLKSNGINNPVVVSNSIDGTHYVDEALPLGTTRLSVADQTVEYNFGELVSRVSPDSFTQVEGGSVTKNIAKGLHAIVPGSRLELSHTIALNAGVILDAAGVVSSVLEGYDRSLECIQSGQTMDHLSIFVASAGGDPGRIKELLSK